MALDFSQFEQVLASAKNADASKAELRKVLRRVNSAISDLQVALGDMNEILSDDYQPTPKTRKPRATNAMKADGTPAAKRGRKPKATDNSNEGSLTDSIDNNTAARQSLTNTVTEISEKLSKPKGK